MKKIGLVLSGGSAYGYAHIGVLEILQENNIPIDVITGTSMGALVGGLYCAGVTTQQMREILSKFSRRKFIDINPFLLTDGGLLLGTKVEKFLKGIVGNITIENLKIPFRAVATDLESGKKFLFKKGSLVQAIRSSISVPGIFKPVRMGGMCLVDGGNSDNLPVIDARNLGADLVISSDVCTFYKKQGRLRTISEILISSANIFVSNLVKNQSDLGDVYIKIDQPDVSFIRFSYKDALKSIEHGRKYAIEMLPKIKELLAD